MHSVRVFAYVTAKEANMTDDLTATHRDHLNADLLAFIKAQRKRRRNAKRRSQLQRAGAAQRSTAGTMVPCPTNRRTWLKWELFARAMTLARER